MFDFLDDFSLKDFNLGSSLGSVEQLFKTASSGLSLFGGSNTSPQVQRMLAPVAQPVSQTVGAVQPSFFDLNLGGIGAGGIAIGLGAVAVLGLALAWRR